MKTTRWMKHLLVAGALLAGAAGTAAARSPGGELFGSVFAEARMVHRLGLDERQAAQFGEIVEQARASSSALAGPMHEARAAMRAAREAEAFDEASVREAARKHADVMVELAVLRARADAEIDALLTDEQRERRHRKHRRGDGKGGASRL